VDLGNPIAEGNTAKIYLHNNKIIKLFNEYLPETESTYEAEKQNFAHSIGLLVPKILDVTKINGKQAIIMEYIQGRTMGDILSENMGQLEYYMNIFIDIQQKVHNVDANSLESMNEKLERQIKFAPILDNKMKSVLIRQLQSMPSDKRLCHGDFHFYNLIMSNNKVVIIDWVDASSGDIRADVFRTYLLYKQFSEEIAEMYLEFYCDKSGLTKEEVYQWAPIIAAARLSENVSSENPERLLKIINHYLAL
jgi:aminoglycoside phosphotransferase (APT) family kinase protein